MLGCGGGNGVKLGRPGDSSRMCLRLGVRVCPSMSGIHVSCAGVILWRQSVPSRGVVGHQTVSVSVWARGWGGKGGGGKRRSCWRSAQVPCQRIAGKGHPLPVSPPHGLRCSYQPSNASCTLQIYVTGEPGYLGDKPNQGLNPKSSGRMEAPAHHDAAKVTGITRHPQTTALLCLQRPGDRNVATNCTTGKQGTAKQVYAIDFGYRACHSLTHRSVYLDRGRYPARHRA